MFHLTYISILLFSLAHLMAEQRDHADSTSRLYRPSTDYWIIPSRAESNDGKGPGLTGIFCWPLTVEMVDTNGMQLLLVVSGEPQKFRHRKRRKT